MSAPEIDERRAQAVEMYRLGRTLREIGYALGVSHETVRQDLQRMLAWKPKSSSITLRTLQIGEAYLSGGTTLRSLSEEHGISDTAVHRHVEKYRALTGRQA